MNTAAKLVVTVGGFDDLRSRHLRLLQKASELGRLTVFLWSNETIRLATGAPPKFPQSEREYLLKAIRFVSEVRLLKGPVDPDALPQIPDVKPDCWAVDLLQNNDRKKAYAERQGIQYRVFRDEELSGFPEGPTTPVTGTRKKVIATGCYDWLHSGHVRFFEEVSAYGDLYVVVGHDANVRLLKGAPHPMHPEQERRYNVGSIRFVTQALISSGEGWLDAEPEVDRLRPDIYAVNEDGDKGGKREFCARHGIEYLVLKRTPAPGLPPRTSTELRGF